MDGANCGKCPDKDLTERIIAGAIEVHRTLGPGFLEGVYEETLCHELSLNGLDKNRVIKGQRLDFVVGGHVVVEIKAARKMDDMFAAQVLSYLKGTGLKRALLINLGMKRLVDGIKRYSL